MIQFQDRNARQQLISEGIVYTVRNYRKSMGVHAAYYYQDGNRKHICNVKIELIDEIVVPESTLEGRPINKKRYYERMLLSYVSLSGFLYISEWIKAIKQFNKRELPDHVVVLRVTRVE